MLTTRRSFLRAASAAMPCLLSGMATAAEPIARNGRPFFKLSLAAYSFHRALAQNWPRPADRPATMTLEDVIDFCAELDLEGVELTSYYLPRDITPQFLNSIKERTFRLGLDISGTAIGNDFCLPDGPERDAQLAMTRQWIDHAAALGAPVIRIFAGYIPKGETEQAARERCVSGIETALEHAAERGVALALENHGGITATADQLLAIVKAVQPSPWFGVNFDGGNFRTADPYADLEQIAPYAINAQIKASVFRGDKKEPADFERIVEILKSANYRGYLVLEYEEPEDPRTTIPDLIQRLRASLPTT
jgi:sugar phosphate isomerase/epimerase